MKKIAGLAFCLLIAATFAFGQAQDYYRQSYARVSYVNGDVFIQRAGDLGYEEGQVNLALMSGDKLGTREGRAEIHFNEGNYLRIDRHTHVDIAEMPDQGSNLVKLHLISGSIYLRVSYMGDEKSFEVHTPDASFYILEEGLYGLSVRENQETELRVLEGMAEAAGADDSRLVGPEEALIAVNGDLVSGPARFAADFGDSFFEWNRSRDAYMSRAVTQSHLPEEMAPYETELNDYGDWQYEQTYGYVWVPRVHIDWRPYYYGRWLWYPILGWTWISHDPWGWCVYRYGRWQWRLGWGWYWIPTRHWGPAWVLWYHGSHYYGWCPLSYHGYPGVIINNHYYGRYSDYYYPLHSRALTVVHKNQLQARRISRAALAHDRVRTLGKVALTSRQPTIRPVAGAVRSGDSQARRVLARTNMRSVNKAYSPGALSSTSRVRSIAGSGSRATVGSRSVINRSSDSRLSRGSSGNLSRQGTISGARSTASRSGTASGRIKGFPSRGSSALTGRSTGSSRSPAVTSSRSRTSVGSGLRESRATTSTQRIKTYSSRSSSRAVNSARGTTSSESRATVQRTSPSRSTARSTTRKSPTVRSSTRESYPSRTSRPATSSRSIRSSTSSRSRTTTVRAPSRTSRPATSPRSVSSSTSSRSRTATVQAPSRMSSGYSSRSASRSASPSRITSSRSPSRRISTPSRMTSRPSSSVRSAPQSSSRSSTVRSSSRASSVRSSSRSSGRSSAARSSSRSSGRTSSSSRSSGRVKK